MLMNLRRFVRREIGFRSAVMGVWGSFRRRLGRREFGRAYFEHVYCEPDPWEYESSPYEKKKYAVLLASLPKPTYDHILEIGCSTGVFTEMVASKGKRVTAVDISAKATASAQRRCRHLNHVHVRNADFLELSENKVYDLILAAEILYFLWQPPRLRAAARDKLAALLADGGTLALVWGGFRLEQDWDAFLQENGTLRLRRTELHEDPQRPFRISFFGPAGRRSPGERHDD